MGIITHTPIQLIVVMDKPLAGRRRSSSRCVCELPSAPSVAHAEFRQGELLNPRTLDQPGRCLEILPRNSTPMGKMINIFISATHAI